MKSKKYRLNWLDLLKGLLVASLTGCVSVLQQGLMTGNPNIELIWMNAMAGGIGYLFKNFFEGK